VLFLGFVRCQQNRHRKVLNKEALFLKFDKKTLIYSVLQFNLGSLEIVWWGLSPPKPCGDGTGYQETSISKILLSNHAKFIKMRVTPFLSFTCWNDCLWQQMLWHTVEKGDFYETHTAYRWFCLTLLGIQTDNLSSKLPVKTHQLHYPASRTSFSDTITSYRKTSVLLKLCNVAFAEFLTSIAKF